jgi:DNA-directed RNA polymerase subunit RPC12/RpoP
MSEAAEGPIVCPKCASPALYRFGHVRSGLQRYVCLICGRQFIPGHERRAPRVRPACPECASDMHVFKKLESGTVFRCSRYPECRGYLNVGHLSADSA